MNDALPLPPISFPLPPFSHDGGPRSAPHWGPGRAFAVFGVYLASQLAIAIIVGFLGSFVIGLTAAASRQPLDTATVQGRLLMPILLASGVLSAGGAVGFSLIHGRQRVFATGPDNFGVVPTTLRGLLVGALGGLILAASFVYLAPKVIAVPPIESFGPVAQAAAAPCLNQSLWLVYALLVAPIAEEYVFRGVLASGLRVRLQPILAGAVVTFIFAVLHLTEALAYWPAILSITALGAWASLLRERTGSLAPAITAHFAYNLVVGFQVLLESH